MEDDIESISAGLLNYATSPQQEPAQTTSAQVGQVAGDLFKYATEDDYDPVEDYEGGPIYRALKGARDKTSFVADVAQGVASAPFTIPQGPLELVSSAFDYAFGTNTTGEVTEFFEGVRDIVVPDSSAGKVANDIATFGSGFVGGVAWLNHAQAVRKGLNVTSKGRFMKSAEDFGRSALGRAFLGNRKKLIATTGAYTAAYSGIISPDGRANLADSLDFLPEFLQIEETEGLEGQERALAVLKNKGRNATLDGLTSLGFDYALAGAGAAAGALAVPVGSVLNTAKNSSSAQAMFSALETVTKTGTYQQAKRKASAFLSPNRGTDPFIMEAFRNAKAKASAENTEVLGLIGELETEGLKFARAAGVQGNVGSRAPSVVNKDLDDYISGATASLPAGYTRKAHKIADKILLKQSKLFNELMYEFEQIATKYPGTARAAEANRVRMLMLNNQNQSKQMFSRIFEVHQNPENFYKNFDINNPLIDDAIDQTGRNIRPQGHPGGALSAQEKADAENIVLESLGLQSVNSGLPLKEALEKQVEAIKQATSGEGIQMFRTRSPELPINTSMFIDQKDILDKTPALRQLLGEVTDPKQRIVYTIDNLAKNASSMRFYSFASDNMSESLFNSLGAVRQGGRPLVIDTPNLEEMAATSYRNYMQPFEQAAVAETTRTGKSVTARQMFDQYQDELTRLHGYVRLGLDDVAEPKAIVGAFGDLTGKLVTKEFASAITAAKKMRSGYLGKAVSLMNSAVGEVQRATVILNPSSRTRDMIGSTLSVAGTGNLNRELDIAGQIQLAFKSFSELDDIGIGRLREKLELAGVRDTNVYIRLMQQYKDDLKASGLGAVSSKVDQLPVYGKINKFFEDVAGGTDLLMKTVGLAGEEQKLASVIARAGLSQNDPALVKALADNGLVPKTTVAGRELIAASNTAAKDTIVAGRRGLSPYLGQRDILSVSEVIAAQNVKNMFANYDMVGVGIREFYDRFPLVGNFTSFAAETIRNSYNILGTGLKELSFKVPDNLIGVGGMGAQEAKLLEQGMRAQGMHRLLSYSAVAGAMPYAVSKASMLATGTSEEELEAARALGDDYLQGATLAVLPRTKDGVIEVVNLNQTLPYAFALEGINAAIQSYSANGLLNKSEAEKIGAAAGNFVWKYFEPFGELSIVNEKIFEAATNRTTKGAQIHEEADELGDKAVKKLLHVFDAFIPGWTKLMVSTDKGAVEQGNVTRAITGTPIDSSRDAALLEEAGKILTGATPIRIDAFKQAQFKAEEYSSARSASKGSAMAAIQAADKTEGQMISAWDNYLNDLYRHQSKLYGQVQNMRQMDLNDSQIRIAMSKLAQEGSAEINSILKGEFYPGYVSQQSLKKLNTEIMAGYDNRLVMKPPVQTLFEMSRDRSGAALRPVQTNMSSEQVDDIAATLMADIGVSGSTTTQPLQTAPAQPVGPVTYQPPAPTAPAGPVPNELLGANPFEQMRNAPLQSLRPVARP